MQDGFSQELERFLDKDGLVVREISSARKEEEYSGGSFEVIDRCGYAIYQNGGLKFVLIEEHSRWYTSKWSYDWNGTPSSSTSYYCVVNGAEFEISRRVYDKAGAYKYVQQRKNADQLKRKALNFIWQKS